MFQMSKTFITAAFATIALAGIAVPAQAAQSTGVPQCDPGGYSISKDATTITMQLEQQGYKVDGVEDWNNCVRAFVVKADGSTGMAFFDPVSLKPVGGDYKV
jgi:hypothetical protein